MIDHQANTAWYKAYKLYQLIKHQKSRIKKILDFGSGDGLLLDHFRSYFPQAVAQGVDIQDSAHPLVAKISKDPAVFCNDYFDWIVASDVFHHIAIEQSRQWLQVLCDRLSDEESALFILEQNPLGTNASSPCCLLDASLLLSNIPDGFAGRVIYFGHFLALSHNFAGLDNLFFWCKWAAPFYVISVQRKKGV